MKKGIKILLGIICVLLCLIIAAGVAVLSIATPKVTIDFSLQSDMTGRASGFLYGFAEEDIPTREIAESIGINGLATKTAGGLQHPIGDVTNVSDTFLSAGGEMLMVYTQDMYDTWYYQLDSLEEYNEKVRKTVTVAESSDYADHLVYCIYNEMDNGVWFGNFWEEENRYTFYDAWASTYAMVRSINPDAKIAGPGHAGFNGDFIREFLSYCKEHDCLPDTVVWHELAERYSLYFMDDHFDEYYGICDELGIERLPVCISEYGLMRTNGIPGESVKWISRLEKQDAYGCVAYWRLANNLSDTVADDVTPNSNYWVYKFYAEMKGKELFVFDRDLMHSNVENYIKGKEPLSNLGFSACASFDETENKFYILAGGTDRSSKVKIQNIDDSYFKNGDKVTIKVKSVDYMGLGGAVYSPDDCMTVTKKVSGSSISFTLPCESPSQAFFVEIIPYDGSENNTNKNIGTRYEAEDAKLSGNAVATNETAYAYSGTGLVKGLDKNSSIQFRVDAEKNGTYNFEFVYGNGPVDGARPNAEVKITIDGEKSETYKFPSSIKEDYMECISIPIELTDDNHKVVLEVQNDAVLSLDLLKVTMVTDKEREGIYFDRLTSRNTTDDNAYSVIVNSDGYYNLSLSGNGSTDIKVNGIDDGVDDLIGSNLPIYLHRGYNKLIFTNDAILTGVKRNTALNNTYTITPDDVTVYGGATVEPDANTSSGMRIGWISSETDSGCTFNIKTPKAGYYNFTFEYANNEEGGYHDYNVDLIERYITIEVNGEKIPNVFFRSTYSWENYKTKTAVIYLSEGDNEIRLSNDGSYNFNGNVTYAPNIGSITVNNF
ncbi:MAG: carbohydrate-binding protein [Oscillospiraceae bacterium]|nr:carbohydrate-binding protein [Oscillospiraceae bacterium]